MRALTADTIFPKPLLPGDVIGIAAPAGAFDDQRFQDGINILKKMGFEVAIPEMIFAKKRYLAGTDENRADVLNRLFADPSIQAIMCARGGFGSMRLLPFVDFDIIRQNPKFFAGFSDISALLNVIFEKTRLVTFHAPVVTSLANAHTKTTLSLTAGFAGKKTALQLAAPITIANGKAAGIVRGGNLASLCQLIGTPFQPNFTDSLLFFEDTNEAPYRIDRMLTQMRLAGCLDAIAGVLLGRFDQCGQVETVYEVIKEQFADHVPILAGLDVGHAEINLTLPLGMTAVMDADAGLLTYQESIARSEES